MKKSVVFFVIGIFVMSGSCEDHSLLERFYTIYIINNSSEKVYFSYGLFNAYQYPDTTLPVQKPGAILLGSGAKYYIDNRKPWSEEMNELPADTLSFFFFDKTVFEDSSWADIKNDYLVLKRYDLSLQDLERLNFNVPYPPDETMEGMQMYPPE